MLTEQRKLPEKHSREKVERFQKRHCQFLTAVLRPAPYRLLQQQSIRRQGLILSALRKPLKILSCRFQPGYWANLSDLIACHTMKCSHICLLRQLECLSNGTIGPVICGLMGHGIPGQDDSGTTTAKRASCSPEKTS